MDIKLLGELSAHVGERSFAPTAGKHRQILSLLALHPDRVVPVAVLMDEVWGTTPPGGATTTLQTYILQLRRRLGAALGPDSPRTAKQVLATGNGGYVLRIPRESVDAHRFERLVADGRAAFERGDYEQAGVTLRRALDLWQGPALIGGRVGPILEIEAMRLDESHLGALELRIDADLRLGRAAELLTELTALTARHPLHEGLHSQEMVALYQCGRQAQALDVYRDLRRRLVDEIGLEPSPRLQRLHQAVLSADPALDAPFDPRPVPTYRLFAA